jgi:ribosomal protein S17
MSERSLRKTRVGTVASDKMDKTIVVAVIEHVRHPLYKKIVKRTYKLKANVNPVTKSECWRPVRSAKISAGAWSKSSRRPSN